MCGSRASKNVHVLLRELFDTEQNKKMGTVWQ
jgi:hypothetical protein